ncbi:MAG: type VI secretion system baseplate subunit TssK [Desulfobacterales bacterium]|nr:type VI secretion system baseplate subunit TssK [Desulfobacterales bacterium]
MSDAANLPDAIQWHEGMMLAPQHFQQLCIRQEELLHYNLSKLFPFSWGVINFKIDKTLLIEGLFKVLEFEAIMPDGIVVYYNFQNGKDLEIDITSYAEEMRKTPLTIHIAIPIKKIGINQVKGALDRYYSTDGDSVFDENTSDSEIVIPRLKPHLTLISGKTPPPKFTSIPVAKIIFVNDIFTLADYTPPALSISLDSDVGKICLSIAQRLREKAIVLSEKMNAPSAIMKGAMILEHKYLIQNLVSSLPQFEAVLYTGLSHPYQLYVSLCSIVGSIAGVGLGLVPPVLHPYNHNELLKIFIEVKSYIFKMIEEGIIESHSVLSFDFDDGIFSIDLKEDWLQNNLIVGIRGRSDMTEKDIIEWMESCLIGSEHYIESMKEKRILGAKRKKIEGDEKLVPARGVVLFSISNSSEFIKHGEKLKIFNTTYSSKSVSPLEIRLYIKNSIENK